MTEKSNQQQLLNTDDLKKGITYVVTRGNSTDKVTAADFDVLFQAKAKAMGLLGGSQAAEAMRDNDLAKSAGEKLTAALDQDGDGQITSKDFELMFNRQMAFIDAHRTQVDKYLPFVGQCAFGVAGGWAIGRVANRIIKYKLPILVLGFGGYSGLQYLAQNNYINQAVMQEQFEQQVKKLLDVNKDGTLDRRDVEALIDKKMEIVTAKLGPGGLAPGLAGYATFGFGLLKGLRCF
jgi:hypothetical protein